MIAQKRHLVFFKKYGLVFGLRHSFIAKLVGLTLISLLYSSFSSAANQACIDALEASKITTTNGSGLSWANLTGKEISTFHSTVGYRSEQGPSQPYQSSFAKHRSGEGEFIPPKGMKVGDKLGEGMHSEAFLTEKGDAIKVAKSPDSAIAIQTEAAATRYLESNYSKYGIKTEPILEVGENGVFMVRRRLEEEGMAGRVLSAQGKLTDLQMSELEKTWKGVRKLAQEKDIHLDFTSDNLFWNGKEWVIFDAGPRTGSRKTKYTTKPKTLSSYLKIWNANYLANARHTQVVQFLNGKMTDAEVPHFIAEFFPETRLLTGEVHPSVAGKKEAISREGLPSEKVFGAKHMEFDRTVNAIMFLKWARENNLEKITSNQSAPKLIQRELDEINMLLIETLKSLEDWDAMLTYMAIHDAAKPDSIADFLRQKIKSDTVDHDRLLIEALDRDRSTFPSFQRLSSDQKSKIIAGMRADFNMGQFNQAENLPANLKGLSSLDGKSTDFYLVHVLADIAGVLGFLDANGAKLMNSNVYRGFSHGIEALRGVKQGKSVEEIYNDLLHSHANRMGILLSSGSDRATMRLAVLFDAQTTKEVDEIQAAIDLLPSGERSILVGELNKTGVSDSGILIYFLPAVLKALKAEYGTSEAAEIGIPLTLEIFRQGREEVSTEQGVFTVHAPELKDLATKEPARLKNGIKFRLEKNNDSEATVVVIE